jgi:hypothetical protein
MITRQDRSTAAASNHSPTKTRDERGKIGEKTIVMAAAMADSLI